MNFMADSAVIDRQIFVKGKPMSKIAAFLMGAFAAAFVMLPLACVFWYFVLQAALTEADFRAARAAIIAISESDKRCLQWQERADGWICVKR